MYDAEGPPVGFSRNWLVQTVLRRAKRVGWRLYEQFEFTAMTPINQDEMEIYGIDSADKALLRRRVKTEWTHRRAGRTFIWSEGFGKIGLSLEGSSFRGEGDRATNHLFDAQGRTTTGITVELGENQSIKAQAGVEGLSR